jgi:hypothetical protein
MYQLGKTDPLTNQPYCIFRLVDHTSIPLDPANTDYQAYLKHIAEGGVVLPADEQGEAS